MPRLHRPIQRTHNIHYKITSGLHLLIWNI